MGFLRPRLEICLPVNLAKDRLLLDDAAWKSKKPVTFLTTANNSERPLQIASKTACRDFSHILWGATEGNIDAE
jgi:hypothetical protein